MKIFYKEISFSSTHTRSKAHWAFAVFSLMMLLFLELSAQTGIITLGTGTVQNTNTMYPAPYGNWYWGARNQFLITASELNAEAPNITKIYSLAFDVAVANGVALQNFEIKIGHSLQTSLTTWDTSLTSVYFNPSYTETSGWNTHVFSAPFTWNGADNIVVETCFNNSSYTYNAVVNMSALPVASSIYLNADAANVCTNPAVYGSTNNRPNIQLTADYQAAALDAGVIAIVSPSTGCQLGSGETVSVSVKNFGSDTISNFMVVYDLQGSPVTETITDTIFPGDTLLFTFSATANLSVPGLYSIDSWTILPGDSIPQNDSLGIQVSHDTALTAFPVLYDISSESVCSETCGSPCPLSGVWSNSSDDDINWTVDAGGTPTPNTGPAVDHTSGNFTGKYLYLVSSGCPNKEAILLSPCIDLGGLSNPYFEFASHLYGFNMGTLNVDVFSGGIWTNIFSVSGQQQTSESQSWSMTEINLGSFSGVIRLRIRGITGSGMYSDMAIDDLRIYDKPMNDVGVIAIDAPNSGYLLSNVEPVSITIRNFGVNAQDSFPVSYRISGGIPVTETVYPVLAPGDTMNFTFANKANLSLSGNYTFDAWSNLAGDQLSSNDSALNKTVVNDTAYVVFGTGDSTNSNTNYPAPYGNWYTCSKHQILIRASEIQAKGINVSGYINSIGFNVSDNNGVPLKEFTIKMKNTTDTVIAATFSSGGLTTVWGPQNYADVNGWNMHVLSAPFYINPSLNLLIETCFCNGISNYTYNAVMYSTTTSFPSVLYSITDGDSSHCSNATGGATSSFRPDIKLSFTADTFPPSANFFASDTTTCTGLPVQIQFMDSSAFNPQSWFWNFGDGNTDSVKNPIHTYTSAGLFTVTLIVTNDYGSDTLIFADYIHVKQPLLPAVCNPTVAGTGSDVGIYNVTFNSIVNNTGSLAEGYTDYSCSFSTTVMAGSTQTLLVQTGPVWNENVRGWIDFNNNGQFNDSTELILVSDNKAQFHNQQFIIPQNVVYDTILRMRIASDYFSSAPPSSCGSLTFGQAEDYGVTIIYPNSIFITDTGNDPIIRVSPIPSDGLFSVYYNLDKGHVAGMKISNLMGQVILNEKTELLVGNEVKTLNLGGRPPGIYFIEFEISDSNSDHKKFQHYTVRVILQ